MCGPSLTVNQTVLYAHLGRGAGVTTDAGYSVRVEILARQERSNRGTTIAIAESAVEENGVPERGYGLDSTTVSQEELVLLAAGQSSSSSRSSATSP